MDIKKSFVSKLDVLKDLDFAENGFAGFLFQNNSSLCLTRFTIVGDALQLGLTPFDRETSLQSRANYFQLSYGHNVM